MALLANVYDSSFVCTYKRLIDDDDDDLYRIQFMQAFCTKEWNDTLITHRTDAVFKIVSMHFSKAFEILRTNNTKFSHMMLFMGAHLTDENLFKILFCMDLFAETHACICDVLNNKPVDPKHLAELKIALMD